MSHAPLPPPSFAPDFSKGLVPAIAQDAATGEVLMLAYMDENAWNATLRTGEAHYWSRSRQELWHKGGTSGNVQKVQAIRLDCDADTILLLIEQIGGAACHTGRASGKNILFPRSDRPYGLQRNAFQTENAPDLRRHAFVTRPYRPRHAPASRLRRAQPRARVPTPQFHVLPRRIALKEVHHDR